MQKYSSIRDKMNDTFCMPDECSWSCSSSDDDFEQKLLLHCEAHAHEDESLVDTTFDKDDDEESALSFTIFQIETGPSPSEVNIVTQDCTSKAINVVFTIHEEGTGFEVTMLRVCSSCAMDVDFERKCPYCVAAKKFDLNFQEDSSSLGLDLDLHLVYTDEEEKEGEEDLEWDNNKQVLGILQKEEMTYKDSIHSKRVRNKNRILKGMIATCLQQNKILSLTNSPPAKEVMESRDDTSPIIRNEAITDESQNDFDLSVELRNLNVREETIARIHHSDLHKLSKVTDPPGCEPNIIESNMVETAQVFHKEPALPQESNHVDELDVRYQLMQLEKYYSKQHRI